MLPGWPSEFTIMEMNEGTSPDALHSECTADAWVRAYIHSAHSGAHGSLVMIMRNTRHG
jgi:hypothetical protein